MDDITVREFNYKMDAVIEYLKNNKGYDHKLYNHDPDAEEPDSDIVEYADDAKDIFNNYINYINDPNKDELPF